MHTMTSAAYSILSRQVRHRLYSSRNMCFTAYLFPKSFYSTSHDRRHLPQSSCSTFTAMRPVSVVWGNSALVPPCRSSPFPHFRLAQRSGKACITSKSEISDNLMDLSEVGGSNAGEEEMTTPNNQDSKRVKDVLSSIPGAEKGGKKLVLVYTCGVCDTRTAQKFTEQAYRNGVVLCRCPGCKRWHLIADRLGYFEDPVDGGWDIQKLLHGQKEITKIISDESDLMEFVESAQGDDTT